MTEKEGCESLRHATRIIHLQQVRCVGENEGLDVWQPAEQQLLSLIPDRGHLLALRSDNSQDRLGNATRIFPIKGPMLHGWQLLAEKCMRVGHELVEGARERLNEYGAVAAPAGNSKEIVEEISFIISSV